MAVNWKHNEWIVWSGISVIFLAAMLGVRAVAVEKRTAWENSGTHPEDTTQARRSQRPSGDAEAVDNDGVFDVAALEDDVIRACTARIGNQLEGEVLVDTCEEAAATGKATSYWCYRTAEFASYVWNFRARVKHYVFFSEARQADVERIEVEGCFFPDSMNDGRVVPLD
jgi:hypothetical protein